MEVAIEGADRPAVEVVVGVANPLDRVLEVLEFVLGDHRQGSPGDPLERGDRIVRAVAEVTPADGRGEPVEVRPDALEVLGLAVVADLVREQRGVAEAGGNGESRGFEGRPGGGRLAEPASWRVLVTEVAMGDAVEPIARDQLEIEGKEEFLLGGEPVFEVMAVLVAPTLPTVVGRHADLSGGGVHPAPFDPGRYDGLMVPIRPVVAGRPVGRRPGGPTSSASVWKDADEV